MFLSTVTNSLDAKGRVSVPADFRSVVANSSFDGIIVWPSFDGAYLEGGGIALLEDYQKSLDHIDHYDDCLLYTSPSPRDGLLSRMPSSA